MNDYIIVIMRMLFAIHYENIILFSVLTGEGPDGEGIKKMKEEFDSIYKGGIENDLS